MALRAASTLTVILALVTALAQGSAGQPLEVQLASASASRKVATQYPRSDLRIRLRLRYSAPGTVLDTVGIDTAPVGSFYLRIDPDGRLRLGEYAPSKRSPVRDPNGWHALVSRTALRKDQEYTVALELGGPRNRLIIEGEEEAGVDLGTPLSGEPVWAGDYPGDDHFGPRFNIHPGMVGAVTVLYLGSAAADDGASPAVASAQQRIGPDGGTVRLPDGTRLVFPAGAVRDAVPVKLERLAPEARFQGEGLVWDLLECTAPVKEFPKAVELRVPLPAEFAGENASSVLVGFLEESYNAIHAAIGKVEPVGDHAELVLSTTHFTRIVINRPRFPGRRTKLGTVLHVPWYGQGEAPGEKVGYCYAAALQMICEAVNPTPAPDHTVYDVVGRVGANPAEGFSAWDARWSEKIDPLIKARTGLKPKSVERTIWYGAKALTFWQNGLAGYLRSRIDLGYPVYLNGYRSDDEENPGSKERKPHAVVVVGYRRDPATGAYRYYVHDPTKLGRNPAYDLRTPQQLGLDVWDITYPFASVALLQPCTATRLETLNVPNDAFQLIKRGPPARVYSFHWDHRTPQGYAWRLRGGAGVTEADVDAIPADVDELRVSPDKNAVPVVNARPQDDSVVEMQFEVYSLRTATPKRTYLSPPVRFTVPALNLEYGKFAPVALDEFRDPEAAGSNTYEIRLRITAAGKAVDEAGARFILGDPAPQIRSLSPPGGEPGSLVRIIGLNFGKALPGSTVKFNGQEATVRSWSEAAIEVEVPRSATSGDVLVLRSGVKSNAVAFQVGVKSPQPVYFTAQRTLTSPLGKSKQQCLDYTLTIRRGPDAVWSGVSEQASETNGLLSTTLAPGEYGFEIAYRYRRPAASGKIQGKFTVTPGGVEVIVDTETGAATVRPRSTTAVKPDNSKPDTPVTVPFSAAGTFSSILLSRPLPGGGEEAAGSVPATGKLAFSGTVLALTHLGAGGRVIAPAVGASIGTTVTVAVPQGEKRDDTAEVNASGSCTPDATTVVTEVQNVRTEWTFRPTGFIVSHTEPFVRDGKPAYRVVEASGSSIALRLTPGTSASLIRVFAVEAKRRSGNSETTESYRGRVLIGTVRITLPGG